MIREEAVYDGIRVTFIARVGSAKVPVQVDVGFGDSTNPRPELVEIPPLLDIPSTKMMGYRRELVVAEKFHAMVDLGLTNSRMKDFFDIWFLARQFLFDGRLLVTAVSTTFERRQTKVPSDPPLALTDAFAGDVGKLTQWLAFTKRARIEQPAPSLFDATSNIKELMLPVAEAIASHRDFNAVWKPNGPWKPSV
jgi:hypothetical protein